MVSRRSVEAKDADREERRKAHYERALAAAGKAPAAADAEDGDGDDSDPDEPAQTAPKDETEEQKSERLARLDKLKSHKHLDKAKNSLANEIKEFEKKERDLERQRAHDQRVNDAATREYGPIVMGRDQYKQKDYRTAKKTAEDFFGDTWENISRNFWGATKDGMANADVRHELSQLKAQLAERDQAATKQKETETRATADRQSRADFGKALKAHPLFTTGDEELQARAHDLWRDSWDPDLEEHSLSKKKAADQIYNAELERAQRLTGRKPRQPVARETREREEPGTKPMKEWSREEKRKHHLDRALRQTGAAKRERERHA